MIHQEDIITTNIYVTNIRAPKYIKQVITYLKGEIENNTRIVGDFNTPVSAMDISSRQKTNKETLDLSHTEGQLILTYLKKVPPRAAEFTFFSSAHKILQDRSYDRPQNNPNRFKS